MADLWASDHAKNFCITADHLYRDWLRRELSDSDYLKLKGQIESILRIKIGIIRDVCDGTKHLHLSKPPHMQISDSGMKQGAFSKAFSRAFDIGGLYLTLHDGSKLYFDNVAVERGIKCGDFFGRKEIRLFIALQPWKANWKELKSDH